MMLLVLVTGSKTGLCCCCCTTGATTSAAHTEQKVPRFSGPPDLPGSHRFGSSEAKVAVSEECPAAGARAAAVWYKYPGVGYTVTSQPSTSCPTDARSALLVPLGNIPSLDTRSQVGFARNLAVAEPAGQPDAKPLASGRATT